MYKVNLIIFILILVFASGSCRKNENDIPFCINHIIENYKQQAKKNPPIKIYSYQYGGKKVFYVTSYCCDMWSILYDENCNILCHPDGGFVGNGDGKCSDFFKKRTNEKLIWEDTR